MDALLTQFQTKCEDIRSSIRSQSISSGSGAVWAAGGGGGRRFLHCTSRSLLLRIPVKPPPPPDEPLAHTPTGAAYAAATAAVESKLQEADSLVKRLELEGRSLPAAAGQATIARAQACRGELRALKQLLLQATAGGSSAAASGGPGTTAADQRARALAMQQRLQATSDRLQQGKQQLAEAEVRACSA
jgi:hypothetical protein